MWFIPYKKCIIETGRTKGDVLRILRASIGPCKEKDQTSRMKIKPYIGKLDDEKFSISPRSSSSYRASLLIKGRFIKNGQLASLALVFTWNTLDYIFNGIILGCFAAMSFFCLRHVIHQGFFHTFDLFPPLALVAAYFIIMLMFNMSVRHRKQEFIDLFAGSYRD